MLPVVHLKRAAEEVAETGECALERTERKIRNNAVALIKSSQLAQDPRPPGQQDPDQDRALDVFTEQPCRDNDPAHRQNRRNPVGMKFRALKFLKSDQRFCVVLDQVCVLKRDKRDKETDPDPGGFFQGQGDRVENLFPDGRDREEQEDQPFNKDRKKSKLPREAHGFDHGKSKVCVQAHGRRKGKGIVGKPCHQCCPEERGKSGCDQHAATVHACAGKDSGVDRQNVCHGKEGGDPCDQFGPDRGIMFFQMKGLFKKLVHGCSCSIDFATGEYRTFFRIFKFFPGLFPERVSGWDTQS